MKVTYKQYKRMWTININDRPEQCKDCDCEYCRTFCKNYSYENTPNEDCIKEKSNEWFTVGIIIAVVVFMFVVMISVIRGNHYCVSVMIGIALGLLSFSPFVLNIRYKH